LGSAVLSVLTSGWLSRSSPGSLASFHSMTTLVCSPAPRSLDLPRCSDYCVLRAYRDQGLTLVFELEIDDIDGWESPLLVCVACPRYQSERGRRSLNICWLHGLRYSQRLGWNSIPSRPCLPQFGRDHVAIGIAVWTHPLFRYWVLGVVEQRVPRIIGRELDDGI
jgi:hypothetical protein